MITEIHTFERKAEAEAFAAGAKRADDGSLAIKQVGVIVQIEYSDPLGPHEGDKTLVIGHDRKTELILEAIKVSRQGAMTNDDVAEWFRSWANKAVALIGWKSGEE